MCGLAGIHVSLDRDPWRPKEIASCIASMTSSLTHRGPDDSGKVVFSPIAFGHCRLSILDLSEMGAQPMRLGVAEPVIIYNGEVYNFLDLRRELEESGCSFRGQSDTEVVLQAYAQWGLQGLKRLEGIFALAAVGSGTPKTSVDARSLGGQAAVLWGVEARLGLFGSEIKAVLLTGLYENLRESWRPPPQ